MQLGVRSLLLVALFWPSALAAQQRRVQFGAHAGVLDDGRGLLGGQIGVAVAPKWAIAAAGTRISVGATGSLSIWEVDVRWLPGTGPWRPYALAGLGYQRARAPGVASDDQGFIFGAGLEAGRGAIQPFAEARGYKNGSVSGLFWAGIRLALGARIPDA